MGVDERTEGERRERKAGQRDRGRDRDQPAVAADVPDEGHDRIDQRQGEREDESEMAGLDDHAMCP